MTYQHQEYPKYLYHATLAREGKLFTTAAETNGLDRQGWVDTPAKFPQVAPPGLAERYRALGPFERFGIWAGVASILGLLIAVVTFAPPWLMQGPDGVLVQTGVIQTRSNVIDPTFDVYFPISYERTPEITWPNMPYEVRMLEQRPDGFKVQFTGSDTGGGPPRWQARGLRKQ